MANRLERLLNLTAALLNAGHPLTSGDIAEQVPGYPDPADKATFRRAFERDKESLRDMGIPVELVDVPGSDPPEPGYRIRREDYALRDPGLDADELAAIHLATAAVRMEGLPGTEAIWKLGGAPSPATDGVALAALPAIPQLVPLFGAVAERAPVTFGYRSEVRTIDPYRLSFSRGRWYLDGWDHIRQDDRQFRLDRIEGEVGVGAPGSFERPERPVDGPAQPWQLGVDEPVTARLAIDADQAGWALDHLGDATVVAEGADGAIVVELTVTNRDAFRSFVLGFLEHAEVVGPPELRDELVDWLRGVGA
ncbi:MAG: pafB [Acidimicrobiales bacterium]|nr:pafB [Acidimicrobiales bacterium]